MNNQRVFLTQSALWAAFDGFTSVYLAAFALALGASNIVVGLLGAIPFLASIVTQIPGAEFAQHFPRIKVYVYSCLAGRVFWLPLLLAPYFFTKPLVFIVIFYTLCKLGETLSDPSWTTVMAEVVEQEKRGDFMSQRFKIIGTFGMIATVFGGLWLKQFPKESPLGFSIMFSVGFLIAILATVIMLKIKEPRYRDHDHHTIKEFFTLNGPMRTFVIFGCVFNLAFMLASPFFVVFMLKNLDISYQYYGIVASITTLAQIISSRYIGKLTDTYGDKPIAVIGHIGTVIVPLTFLLINKQSLWLLIPVQIFSGIVWAAADISRFNMLLDLADPKRRALQIAEYNLYASIPLVIAPILGGWITEHVTLILTGLPLVFVMSSVLRAVSILFLIPIKEPRARREYPAIYVFKEAIHFHPNRGIVHAVHIVKRVATGLWPK